MTLSAEPWNESWNYRTACPQRLVSNRISHTSVMAEERAPWAPPLVEMTGGIVGHLLAWERHELDGSWWAWVSWVQESGGRRLH